MEFRLLYSGPLVSSGGAKGHPKEKHAMRKQFHPQLRRLWRTKRNLEELAVRLGMSQDYNTLKTAAERINPYDPMWDHPEWRADNFTRGIDDIGAEWEREGYKFVPLVAEAYCLRCSLDILFLRPEEGGMILQGGDIDGRIKTVFDALRMPDNLAECGGQGPQHDETPFYVLLQDDKLISEIRVVTDQLLTLPGERELRPNESHLVIHVRLQVTQPTEYAWVFS